MIYGPTKIIQSNQVVDQNWFVYQLAETIPHLLFCQRLVLDEGIKEVQTFVCDLRCSSLFILIDGLSNPQFN